VTRGGRFLEAPVIGNKQLAKDGQLVVISAGDRSLYDDCQSCLQAMARHIFYIGAQSYICISCILNQFYEHCKYARKYISDKNLLGTI